ncbi:MAG TPA: TetR/AcrR family transcriptional regulator [Acidimicrobiales bacterium]|nr:TetR/AcrR family transcriptional regulator [Acidimicrobiales bacterium]
MTERLAHRAVERSVGRRRAEYEAEVARIVEVTFTLIQRTGSLDPSMRDILAEAGLSTQAFYRYFTSKDELMLALLDEGRRQLIETLQRRMRQAESPAEQVRAWIEGVLSQAANAAAAARTRPWVLSEQRLAELFPEEQQSSVDLLLAVLHDPVERLEGPPGHHGADGSASPAVLVYRLTFATLRSHLVARTSPTPAETEALVVFCLRGLTQ